MTCGVISYNVRYNFLLFRIIKNVSPTWIPTSKHHLLPPNKFPKINSAKQISQLQKMVPLRNLVRSCQQRFFIVYTVHHRRMTALSATSERWREQRTAGKERGVSYLAHVKTAQSCAGRGAAYLGRSRLYAETWWHRYRRLSMSQR